MNGEYRGKRVDNGELEIHFYENEFAPKDCLHGWIETRDAVLSGQNTINTTQMGFLSTSLLNCGYRVFLNEENEIKLGENPFTGREIKVGHDLFKLWTNGEFEIKE